MRGRCLQAILDLPAQLRRNVVQEDMVRNDGLLKTAERHSGEALVELGPFLLAEFLLGCRGALFSHLLVNGDPVERATLTAANRHVGTRTSTGRARRGG